MGKIAMDKFKDVEKIVGRTSTWPCKLLIYSYTLLILYAIFSLVYLLNINHLLAGLIGAI